MNNGLEQYELLGVIEPLLAQFGIYFDPRDYIIREDRNTPLEFQAIATAFKTGKLNSREFLIKVKDYYASRAILIFDATTRLNADLDKAMMKGTPWILWRRLFVVLQSFMILATIIVPIISMRSKES